MHKPTGFLDRSFTLRQCFGWLGMVLVLALLGAHFYRAGEYGITLCVAGVLVFSCARTGWKRHAVALFICWGAFEWGEAAVRLAMFRMQVGMPWLRGGGILFAVGLVTLLVGLYARARAKAVPASALAGADGAAQAEMPCPAAQAAPADRSGTQSGIPFFQGLVFISTFLALFYLRRSAPLNFLLLERYLPVFGSVQIFFAAWYAAFVVGKLIDPKTSRKYRRWLWLVFGIAFFIQFFLGLAGLNGMLLTGKLHVPVPAFIIFAPLFRESFSMMPVIVLVATLLAGSAWCSMLCYFGPFDALAAGKTPVRPPSPRLEKALAYGRPAVLAVGSLAAVALGRAGLGTTQAIGIAAAFAAASLFIMAFWSRKYTGMVHCTTFCPMGLAVNLLGRLSPWRLRVDSARCTNCGACEKICRYRAITGQSRARGTSLLRCSLCRDCIGGCKEKAISLGFPGMGPERAWFAFTGLVAVLHALFLSVAMV